MVERETGKANRSFITLSENSLPKPQLVTIPDPITPTVRIICKSNSKNALQSEPPRNEVFALMVADRFAISGCIERNINNPIMTPMKMKKYMEMANILVRRILRTSIQSAALIPLMIFSVCLNNA